MIRPHSIALCLGLVVSAITSPAWSAEKTDKEKFEEFGQKVKAITVQMKGVTQTPTERADLRALEFYLRDYNKAVAAEKWQEAISIGRSMKVYLARGGVVASEAGARKEAKVRADKERQHQELVKQRERHHREQMAAAERARRRAEEQRLQMLQHLQGR